MFEALRTIREAVHLQSTWPFVVVVGLVFGGFGAMAAWATDLAYRNALESGRVLPHPEIRILRTTVTPRGVTIILRNMGDSTQADIAGRLVIDSPDREIQIVAGEPPTRHFEAPFAMERERVFPQGDTLAIEVDGMWRPTREMRAYLANATIRYIVTAEYSDRSGRTRYRYEGLFQFDKNQLNDIISKVEPVTP
jgi:hypothetical protein